MADVIRQDVIQIGFDIDDSPLQDILNELKELKKALGVAVDTEPFDDMKNSADDVKKSVSGITDEVEDLKKETDKAKEGFEETREEVEKTRKGIGGLDKQSFSKLLSNLKSISTQLTNIAKKAGVAALSALKKIAAISFKTLIAGVGAAATAVAGLVTKSVQAYADYEQLVGGVETLFGANGAKSVEEYAELTGKSVNDVKDEYKTLIESQDLVLKNANNAYKTAGLSANAYMETVTGFSASLLQSLDGDTKAAAEYADMALSDMSD